MSEYAEYLQKYEFAVWWFLMRLFCFLCAQCVMSVACIQQCSISMRSVFTLYVHVKLNGLEKSNQQKKSNINRKLYTAFVSFFF